MNFGDERCLPGGKEPQAEGQHMQRPSAEEKIVHLGGKLCVAGDVIRLRPEN